MAISISTFDEALDLARGWVQSEFPDEDLADDSYHGKWARVLALLYWSDQAAIADADSDWPPGDDSSTAALDAAADFLGLPNGAGGFGRLVASVATGGLGTLTGTKGTVYAINSQLVGPDGSTVYDITSAETVPGIPPGTDVVTNVPVSALTAGASGNLQAGAQLQWSSPPAGNQGALVLTSPLAGGTDVESNPNLLDRIRDRVQNPPKAGVSHDWRTWALAAAVPGINEAYIYPLRDGTGTVRAVLTQAGSGIGRKATAGQVTAALASFDANRLVCVAGRAAQAPYMPNGAGVDVVLRIVPSPGNAFDWNSLAGTFQVDAYTAPNLRLAGLAPADLKAAIDAGAKPRVQIKTTGVVLPQEAQCISWSDGGGKTTLVLSPATLLQTVPTIGDAVFASSNATGPVAAAVLALVDALGPSRASGYAEALQLWDDTLRVDQVIRAALDAVDGGGVKLVLDLQTDPTLNGAATNIQAQDNDANGAQMLFLKSVVVGP